MGGMVQIQVIQGQKALNQSVLECHVGKLAWMLKGIAGWELFGSSASA
jgi:hypothetical protein